MWIGLDVFLNSIHCHIISGKSLQILVFLFNLWNPVSKCSQMKCWKCQKLKLSQRSWFKESFQLQRCLFFLNTMSVINHWGIDGVLRNWVFGKNCRILGYMTFFKTTHFPKIRRRKKSDGNKSVVKEYDEDNCDDDDDNNNDDVIMIILTCSGRR